MDDGFGGTVLRTVVFMSRPLPAVWMTAPEILRHLKLPARTQLNLDRLNADGFVARRYRDDGKKEYRADQYIRWRRAKAMFDGIRAQLRAENNVEKSERA